MSLLELERMRAACRTIREKALIDFLYSTGCRVSEVASMKIEDVDFPEGTVHIRHGKGDKERKVYINAESEVSLRAYMEERQDETPYLFVASRRPYGGMGIKSFQSIIKKVAGRTNITKRVTPHIFRHTTGTVAIQHGMPVEQVKEMLGHESLETTMIYAKVDNRQVKANHQRCVV